MSKEAIVFVLDVGRSMWQTKLDLKDGLTVLDKAIKCLSLMQSQKIIDDRKTDQVALVLCSSPETDNQLFSSDDGYEHIVVAQNFGPAQYGMIKYMQDQLPLGKDEDLADPVSAIVVAADLLITLTKGKAYGSKRIIFVSDFKGETPSDTSISDILDTMKGNGLSLDLLNAGEGEETASLQFFEEKLVEPLEGNVFGVDEALEMLADLGGKRARQVATFKGTLDLAVIEGEKGLRIPIAIYSQTSQGKLPTAKKLAGNETIERSLEYRRATIGIDEDESAVQPTIPKDSLIKAYRYGKSLVPFSKIDEQAIGYKSEKGLSILGFVPTSSIEREMFMSAVWLVVHDPGNISAQIGLSSFVQACYEKDMAALARYVRAKGNSPRLVALIPQITPDYAGFLMVSLPFADPTAVLRHLKLTGVNA